jgi:hypothetical protein
LRKRDIKRQFWLNEQENKRLKENAKKVGLSESSYIRNLIMNYKPKEQPNEIIFEFMNQLKGIGTNFNQIARKANALDLIDAPYYKRTYQKWSELEEKIKKELLDME